MIFANIKDKDNYKDIGWLMTALDNAERFSDPRIKTGAYPIDERIRAVVNRYLTSDFNPAEFENHRDYIDVQYIVSGRERIAVAPTENCSLVKEYDPAADYEMYAINKGKAPVDLTLTAGDFAVLFPGETHYPGLTADGMPSDVHKIVFKVRV